MTDAEYMRLRRCIERVAALHQARTDGWSGETTVCAECPRGTPWPCATIQAATPEPYPTTEFWRKCQAALFPNPEQGRTEQPMSDLVPAEEIEQIVGTTRHLTRHYARADSAEETVYILHSRRCLDTGIDLRDCLFSQALDRGIEVDVWRGHEDKPIRVTITRSQRLIPVAPGMKVAD